VAVRDECRRKIPKGLFDHVFFTLHQVPIAHFYVDKEPQWAQLVPCDKKGRRLPCHEPFPICLSWLDPRLKICKDTPDDRWDDKVFLFLLSKASVSNCEHRLQVWYPSSQFEYPTLPIPVG